MDLYMSILIEKSWKTKFPDVNYDTILAEILNEKYGYGFERVDVPENTHMVFLKLINNEPELPGASSNTSEVELSGASSNTSAEVGTESKFEDIIDTLERLNFRDAKDSMEKHIDKFQKPSRIPAQQHSARDSSSGTTTSMVSPQPTIKTGQRFDRWDVTEAIMWKAFITKNLRKFKTKEELEDFITMRPDVIKEFFKLSNTVYSKAAPHVPEIRAAWQNFVTKYSEWEEGDFKDTNVLLDALFVFLHV